MTTQNAIEAMAIAVLKGDLAAACALADELKGRELANKNPNRFNIATGEPTSPLNRESLTLMHQLAEMADIPWGRFRKMILTLHIDDLPRLETFGYLSVSEVAIIKSRLEVKENP